MAFSYNRYGNSHTPGAPVVQIDGPYVQYTHEQVLVNYIVEKNEKRRVRTEHVRMEAKESIRLKVMTDIPDKFFYVRLSKKLTTEKSEYPDVNKLLALSDIEGNFSALRKLLQANNVIDEDFNWKFGDGHLVLVGDFFDRGEQVTEVLWFIYYLEEEAKAAGGYVHFILGNHEIMNLNGDFRYTPQKYLDNAKLIMEDYQSLYDETSELGRWLRTKNVVEKIGAILFLHGGISSAINSMNISVDSINSLARPYYAVDTFDSTDERAGIILRDLGPLWYRGYYMNPDPGVVSKIDSTLSQFGVNHIVTGHTIVSDTISLWYNSKLLDLDVHHASGKSEALLIENNKYYRVNQEGKKVLLLDPNN